MPSCYNTERSAQSVQSLIGSEKRKKIASCKVTIFQTVAKQHNDKWNLRIAIYPLIVGLKTLSKCISYIKSIENKKMNLEVGGRKRSWPIMRWYPSVSSEGVKTLVKKNRSSILCYGERLW